MESVRKIKRLVKYNLEPTVAKTASALNLAHLIERLILDNYLLVSRPRLLLKEIKKPL